MLLHSRRESAMSISRQSMSRERGNSALPMMSMSRENLRTPSLGRSHSWAPEMSFQDGIVPLTPASTSYFNRSWTGGPPTAFSVLETPVWEHKQRVPEKKRLMALAAQQHLLEVLAQEQAGESRHKQHEQALRSERRESIATRHITRHERHLQMGGHALSQHRLYDQLTRPPSPPPPPPPPPPAEPEELLGETSQETLAYLRRQSAELIVSRSSPSLSRSRSSPQHALGSRPSTTASPQHAPALGRRPSTTNGPLSLPPSGRPSTTNGPLPLPPGRRPPPLSLPCSPSTGARGAQQQRWLHSLPSPLTGPTTRSKTRPRLSSLPSSPEERPYTPFSRTLFPQFPRPPQTAPAATSRPHGGAPPAAVAAAAAVAATMPLPASHVLPPGLGHFAGPDEDTKPDEMELDPAARDTPPPSPREAARMVEQPMRTPTPAPCPRLPSPHLTRSGCRCEP